MMSVFDFVFVFHVGVIPTATADWLSRLPMLLSRDGMRRRIYGYHLEYMNSKIPHCKPPDILRTDPVIVESSLSYSLHGINPNT